MAMTSRPKPLSSTRSCKGQSMHLLKIQPPGHISVCFTEQQLLNKFVRQNNNYAKIFLQAHKDPPPNLRARNWKNVIQAELKGFIDCLINIYIHTDDKPYHLTGTLPHYSIVPVSVTCFPETISSLSLKIFTQYTTGILLNMSTAFSGII